MNTENKNQTEDHPSETKIYYGIQYWINVPFGESRFIVTIGQGENAIEEVVECVDVAPENYQELFQQGHAYAQKKVQTQGSDLVDKFNVHGDSES
ncbi:MAG: hypothetical protein B0W54_04855 [Cellvibrio sp. 79]|nr:MAG: hypothetical protein B0W54_04855 [Cellvibrio sp. 79]